MKQDEIISKILGCSIPSYYNWKRDKRPVISLLETFFTKSDLIEWINYKTVSRYNQFNQYSFNISFQYFEFLISLYDNFDSLAIYFEFLQYTKDIVNQDSILKSGVIDTDFVKSLTFRFFAEHNNADERLLTKIINLDNLLLMFIISSYHSNFDIFHNELLSAKLPFNYTKDKFKLFKLVHECFYLVSKNTDREIFELPNYLNVFIDNFKNKYDTELIEEDRDEELIILFTNLNEALIKNEIVNLKYFFEKIN